MSSTAPHRLLDELVKLENLRDPQHHPGKRLFARFLVRGDAELVSVDRSRLDMTPVPILLRDAGRGGLGFVTDKPLEPNSTWRTGFLNRGYVVAQQALTIRHCRQVGNSLYLIGGQFCAESGLLCLLGVDPASITDGDNPHQAENNNTFLSPGEVS